MYANVVDALFYGLPPHGAAVLRFNFRGTSGSEGRHDHGRAEQVDALAAVEELGRRWPGLPLLLAGYSFGADVALAVSHPSISAWLAVAPPLRIVDPAEMTALTDPRPTFVVAAADDQFRPYAELTEILDGAVATSITAVPGADHFFVTGLDQVLVAAVAALGSLAGG